MSSLQELRKIQAERYLREKQLEKKQKEDAEREIQDKKIQEFTEKIRQKRQRESLLKNQGHPSYYATKLVRFMKPWFKKIPEELKMYQRRDLFQMPEGDIVSMDRLQEIISILGYQHYSEYQKNRILRMMKFIDENKYIRYWQDRDFERNVTNHFILEAMFLNYNLPNIEFIPLFEKWVEAFPFEDPFEFIQKNMSCHEKDESNVFKTWRLMRLITIVSQSDFFIPWDLGINEEEFKIYLFQELENSLNSILRINKMLDAEPVEAEIKCGGCGKTNETNWVFCYGNKFRVCRFCATQINPEHRTPIENDTMEHSDNNSQSDEESQSDSDSQSDNESEESI